MKQKKNRKGLAKDIMYCPYCGGRTELRSADGIYHDNRDGTMLYVCKNYPRCDTYVRVRPGTMEPIGTLANGRLRALRTEAHRYFNQLYERGIMSKREAYEWLSQMIGLPMSKTHIGMMGEYYCELVIEESKKLLGGTRRQRKRYYLMNHVGGYRNEINSGAAACG